MTSRQESHRSSGCCSCATTLGTTNMHMKISPTYRMVLTALATAGQFMLIAAALAAAASDSSSSSSSSSTNEHDSYTLEWIGRPEVSREHGPPKQVSSAIYTGDEVNAITISKEFGHSFEIKKGIELELGDLLGTVGLKFGVSMTQASGNKTALHHRLALDKRSKGIVMFNEDLVRLKGRARKRYGFNLMCYLSVVSSMTKPECYKSDEDVDIEVVSTELDATGNAQGTFSVEYLGTDKFRHPEFYNLVNKTAALEGARELEGVVKSAYECAERAKQANKWQARYDVENMKCYIKETAADNGTVFDRNGHPLGDYDPLDTQNLDRSETLEPRERDRWLKDGRCDLIHQYVSTESEEDDVEDNDDDDDVDTDTDNADHSATPGATFADRHHNHLVVKKKKYLCKRFISQPNSVLMFYRTNKNTHRAQMAAGQAPPATTGNKPAPSRDRSSRQQQQQPAELSSSAAAAAAASASTGGYRRANNRIGGSSSAARATERAHPKFYQLTGRQYPVTTASQKVKNVLTAYDCAEQAIGSEKFLAIYKPRDRVCLLEPVVWNFGRLLDGHGKPLGPYGLIHLREKEVTEDADKTLGWFKSGPADGHCDLVHETEEAGSFSCKLFDSDNDDNSIVMLRYVDPYEVKRINRMRRQREYERLLFSGSQHDKFYSIKDKDFPLKCVRTIPGVQSAQQCGEAAIESGKYLAVYKPLSNICILKEVDINEGQAYDRWNKQLGYYDIPFYDAESSQSSRDFDRWIDLNECDVIHLKEDGLRTCKKFPTTDDSILMFRRI